MPNLTEELASGATVVTPTRRLARDLKLRFDAAQIGAGRALWPTADILPWGTWIERTFGELTRLSPKQRVLGPAQELALWQQVIADSAHAHSLLDTGATARVARDAWQIQHEWHLDLTAWRAALPEDSRAFVAWSTRFRELCSVNAWLSGARLVDAVNQGLKLDSARAPRTLLLYGFDALSPQQRALLETCRAAGARVEERRPAGVAARVTRRACTTANDELTGIAWRIQHALAARPEARVGVVVPDLSRRRHEVVRVLDDVLEPARVLPGSRAHSRPYNLSLGIPLSSYPMVHAALLILRLARGALPLQDIGALLRSPFLAAAEHEFTRRALLDAKLRRRGRLDVDLGLLQAEARGQDPADSHTCRVLSARLDAWRIAAAEARAARHAPSGWSGVFLSLLSGLGWPGERTLDSEEYQTWQKWRELVSGLSALDPVLGALRYDEALSWLARLSADTPFQPESEDVPIQVLGVLESAALEFDHLFVTGLHDEVWPEPARPNPLLPVVLQRERGVPHASPEWELGFARRMLALWRSGAHDVELSYPTRDGDRVLRASPLLESVPEANESPAVAAEPSHAEAIRLSARLERLRDSTAPALAAGHRARGGAAVFGNQAACPFRAFALHRMGARGLEEGRPGLNARERGTLLHRALMQLWGDLESHTRLVAMHDDELSDAVGRAADAAIESLRRARPDALSEAFGALERVRICTLLGRLLEIEKQRAPFRVVSREDERPLEIAGLRVQARIDRIDVADSGARVILDYKTGPASPNEWFGHRPDDPQLPLYAITDTADVAAVSFAMIRPQEVRFKGIARDEALIPGVARIARSKDNGSQPSWEALLETWRKTLDALAAEFLSGHAAVAPKNYPRTCENCDLGPLCRVKELFDRGPTSDEEIALG
jgi:probable DNA repair protein